MECKYLAISILSIYPLFFIGTALWTRILFLNVVLIKFSKKRFDVFKNYILFTNYYLVCSFN